MTPAELYQAIDAKLAELRFQSKTVCPLSRATSAQRTYGLADGKFRWPKIEDGDPRLTAAQLQALFEGLAPDP